MDKLKPCPFCGANVEQITAPMLGTQMFVCNVCGADVCFAGAEHEPNASKAWNRRKERRGTWEDTEHAPDGLLYATCSLCCKRQTVEAVNYCGNCGARMDGEEK